MKHELMMQVEPLGPAKRKAPKNDGREQWRPVEGKPDFEVNAAGQLRTKLRPEHHSTGNWSFPIPPAPFSMTETDEVGYWEAQGLLESEKYVAGWRKFVNGSEIAFEHPKPDSPTVREYEKVLFDALSRGVGPMPGKPDFEVNQRGQVRTKADPRLSDNGVNPFQPRLHTKDAWAAENARVQQEMLRSVYTALDVPSPRKTLIAEALRGYPASQKACLSAVESSRALASPPISGHPLELSKAPAKTKPATLLDPNSRPPLVQMSQQMPQFRNPTYWGIDLAGNRDEPATVDVWTVGASERSS